MINQGFSFQSHIFHNFDFINTFLSSWLIYSCTCTAVLHFYIGIIVNHLLHRRTRKLRVIFIFLLFFILNPLLLSFLSGCRRSCLHVWVFQLSCPSQQPSSLTVAGRGQRFPAAPVTEFLHLVPVTEYSYSTLLLNIEIGFMGLFRLSG